ncbi:MAG: hypothetical protein AAFQ80_13230 [Cyanobacteria bacterium J06621_8]
MKRTLQNFRLDSLNYLTIFPTIFLTAAVGAQLFPRNATANTAPNIGNFNSGSFNDFQPINQPDFTIDSSRGSQQFFNRDQQQLFFLPDNSSNPILEIDDESTTTEIDQQEPQQAPANDELQ